MDYLKESVMNGVKLSVVFWFFILWSGISYKKIICLSLTQYIPACCSSQTSKAVPSEIFLIHFVNKNMSYFYLFMLFLFIFDSFSLPEYCLLISQSTHSYMMQLNKMEHKI
jgi:hypothetical protein